MMGGCFAIGGDPVMGGTQGRVFSEKKLRWAARLLPGLVIAAIAWWGWGQQAGMGQPADVTTSAAGRVEGASDVRSLGTSATGTIAELLVDAGTHVRAGQHLVRVECSNIERELEARKSDLAAAEAAFARTLHGPRAEEIAIGIANVNLADARS